MKTAVLISGKQYSGKSTLASSLRALLPGFIINPLAQPLKVAYCAANGLSEGELAERKATDPSIRTGLIQLGADRRAQDIDYWVKLCAAYPGDFIVDDLRFLNEVNFFKDNVDVVYTVRLEASREARALRGTLSNEDDQSECELDNFDSFDYIFDNDGPEEELVGAANKVALATIVKMIDALDAASAGLEVA